jgi:hypothetical protein
MDDQERLTAATRAAAASLRRAARRGDVEAVLRQAGALLAATDALHDAIRRELTGWRPGYVIEAPADLAAALREAREARQAHAWRTRAAWARENLYETGAGLEDGVFFTLKEA